MPSFQLVAKSERVKKLKAVLGEWFIAIVPVHSAHQLAAFATTLIQRAESGNDVTLSDDLQTQIRALPLQASSMVLAKQGELDRLGTELWNLATRLRRDEIDTGNQSNDLMASRKRALPLLRAFSFLLLDSAGGHGTKGCQRKNCIRLIKVALKAARVCIQSNELSTATKVLERAADYQDVLSQEDEDKRRKESELVDDLRAQYFAVRTTLVSVFGHAQGQVSTMLAGAYHVTGMASGSHGHSRAHVCQMQAAYGSTHTYNGRNTRRPTV
jgi:hypothetical protein